MKTTIQAAIIKSNLASMSPRSRKHITESWQATEVVEIARETPKFYITSGGIFSKETLRFHDTMSTKTHGSRFFTLSFDPGHIEQAKYYQASNAERRAEQSKAVAATHLHNVKLASSILHATNSELIRHDAVARLSTLPVETLELVCNTIFGS